MPEHAHAALQASSSDCVSPTTERDDRAASVAVMLRAASIKAATHAAARGAPDLRGSVVRVVLAPCGWGEGQRAR